MQKKEATVIKDNRFSDEELIERSRQGDSACTNELIERYKPLVVSKASSMYMPGAEPCDMIQEGMVGLFAALQDYDFGRDASFATFADLCVSRQMYSAVKASNRQKHQPLNGYVSLSGELDDEAEAFFADRVQKSLLQVAQQTPEDIIMDREAVEHITEIIQTELSDMEQKILELHMMNMSYQTIAGVLNISPKSVDNGLQRIKSKVKRALAKE